MSCGCENKRLSAERERIRRLAKAWAVMEQAVAVLYKKADGTYGFAPESENVDVEIIELITPY